MARKAGPDRRKVQKAAQDNPDLPTEFVEESLSSMAEPRDCSMPFSPRSIVSAGQPRAGKASILRLIDFLKSLPNRMGVKLSRSDLYD